MENYKNSKIGRETAQKYGDILEMERPQTEESLRRWETPWCLLKIWWRSAGKVSWTLMHIWASEKNDIAKKC